MDLSIVIPLYNEEESLKELTEWIERVMEEHNFDYEILFIDDGSTDNSWQIIKELKQKNPRIRAFRFRRNYGKAAGLYVGFQNAKGDVIITMDADLQDSPDEIPELYKMIKEQGYDLVSGWKKKRYDPWLSKNLPSKIFNLTARIVSGIKLHDFNCGLKAYKAKVAKAIEVYGDMHRYIPILVKNAGFKKIGEKVVQHRPRKYGKSKFGASRFIHGFLDLLTITFMSNFSKRPMHFFGTLGLLSFFIGFIILADLTYQKVFNHVYKISERPLFFFGILTVILGTQLFLTGFLGDMISRNSPLRNEYHIDETL